MMEWQPRGVLPEEESKELDTGWARGSRDAAFMINHPCWGETFGDTAARESSMLW